MDGAGEGPGAGDIIFVRVPNSLEGCDGWGQGQGIIYIKASVVQWSEFGPEGRHLFLEIVYFCIFGGAAKLRGARSAPFGMERRPIRRVRAAHGRARAAKTH
jgi:hypothetical protein